jgi:hypothetical protein
LKKIPLSLALLAFLMSPALVLADEIFLNGAGSFAGRITQETDTMVMIDTGDGTIGVPRDRIHHIVKGRSPLDEYEERAKKLKPGDVNGWKELGRWAAHAGISTQSRTAYENVVRVSPNDIEARQALGYVFLDQHWVTEEESYRAKGFVRYQGEWMTAAEVQMHETAQANDQARRDSERAAIDAEVAQAKAEHQAEEDRKRQEKNEEDERRWNNSIYWGGWGYGYNTWPSNYNVVTR